MTPTDFRKPVRSHVRQIPQSGFSKGVDSGDNPPRLPDGLGSSKLPEKTGCKPE